MKRKLAVVRKCALDLGGPGRCTGEGMRTVARLLLLEPDCACCWVDARAHTYFAPRRWPRAVPMER